MNDFYGECRVISPEEAEAIKAAQELNRLMEQERPSDNEVIPRARQELLKFHEIVCERSREVMRKKNHDYASDEDPYRNFRMFGPYGILVRMGDKFSRLRSFEESGEFKVKDERLEDTIHDIINYAILYLGMKTE